MKLSNRTMYFLYLINIIMFASSFTYFRIEKVIFILNFALLSFTIMVTLFKQSTKISLVTAYSKIVLSFVIMFIVYMALSFYFRRSFEGFVPLMYSFMFCFMIANINLEEKVLKRLYITMLVVFLLWIVRIYNYYGYFMVSIYDLGKVNTLNSNLVGMIILLLTILLCALSDKLGIKKNVQLIICVMGIWGIWNAATRGSLMAFLVFLLLNYCIPKRIFRQKSVMLLLYSTIFMVGFIFPIVYVYISKIGVGLNSFLNMKGLFSGRQLVWDECFYLLKQSMRNLLFGIGNYNGNEMLYLSADGNSMHNWYLKMIYSFGLIGISLYFIFIFLMIRNVYKNKVSNVQITFLLGFMAILVNGYFENMLNSYILSCLVYLVLMLAFNPVMYNQRKVYSNCFLPNIRIKHHYIYIKKKRNKGIGNVTAKN